MKPTPDSVTAEDAWNQLRRAGLSEQTIRLARYDMRYFGTIRNDVVELARLEAPDLIRPRKEK